MRKLLPILSMIAITLFFTPKVYSQNAFVKVTDELNNVLVGSSTFTQAVGQTEINSFGQESSSCPIQFGQTSSCNPVTGNFFYNFIGDQTITDYRRALYLRKLWKKVEISFYRQNSSSSFTIFEKVLLEDVYVTDLKQSNNSSGPSEFQVQLDPTKITWTYTSQLGNGQPGTPRTFIYNRQTNTGN